MADNRVLHITSGKSTIDGDVTVLDTKEPDALKKLTPEFVRSFSSVVLERTPEAKSILIDLSGETVRALSDMAEQGRYFESEGGFIDDSSTATFLIDMKWYHQARAKYDALKGRDATNFTEYAMAKRNRVITDIVSHIRYELDGAIAPEFKNKYTEMLSDVARLCPENERIRLAKNLMSLTAMNVYENISRFHEQHLTHENEDSGKNMNIYVRDVIADGGKQLKEAVDFSLRFIHGDISENTPILESEYRKYEPELQKLFGNNYLTAEDMIERTVRDNYKSAAEFYTSKRGEDMRDVMYSYDDGIFIISPSEYATTLGPIDRYEYDSCYGMECDVTRIAKEFYAFTKGIEDQNYDLDYAFGPDDVNLSMGEARYASPMKFEHEMPWLLAEDKAKILGEMAEIAKQNLDDEIDDYELCVSALSGDYMRQNLPPIVQTNLGEYIEKELNEDIARTILCNTYGIIHTGANNVYRDLADIYGEGDLWKNEGRSYECENQKDARLGELYANKLLSYCKDLEYLELPRAMNPKNFFSYAIDAPLNIAKDGLLWNPQEIYRDIEKNRSPYATFFFPVTMNRVKDYVDSRTPEEWQKLAIEAIKEDQGIHDTFSDEEYKIAVNTWPAVFVDTPDNKELFEKYVEETTRWQRNGLGAGKLVDFTDFLETLETARTTDDLQY